MNKNITEQEVLDLVDKSFSEKGCVDIVGLADSMGITVYSADLSHEKTAFLEKKINGVSITVNGNHSKERQRFSIAHEIGHYILHPRQILVTGKVGREDPSCSLSTKEEQQADLFAAKLLMPEKYVKQYFSSRNITEKQFITDDEPIKEAAKKFNVSVVAMIVRMRDLGYHVAYL